MPRYLARRFAAGPGLDIVGWDCDGHDAARPADEVAASDVLMLPVRGRFVVRCASGLVVLDPGRGLLLRAGDRYTARHPGGGDRCIAIRGPAIDRLDHPAVVELDVAAQLALLALDTDSPALAAEEAVAAVTAGRPRAGGGPADRTIARRIARHVAERFDQPLALAELAAAAGVSAFHASRAFRRATGRSIHQHHDEVRLRHALALVLGTDQPLAAIAIATGFANQGHLGSRFRRRIATRPGRARRAGLPR